jgi:hypothetical protein
MLKLLLFVLLILLSLFYSACATIVTGTTDRLMFETNPPGAKIFIDNYEEGSTPTSISVERTLETVDLKLDLEGYKTKTVRLKKTFNYVSVLNLCNPIGWVVDIASGSILRYAPKHYYFELESENKK